MLKLGTIIALKFFLLGSLPPTLVQNNEKKIMLQNTMISPENCQDVLAFSFQTEEVRSETFGTISYCDEKYSLFIAGSQNPVDPALFSSNAVKRVEFSPLENQKYWIYTEFPDTPEVYVLTLKKVYKITDFRAGSNAVLFRSNQYLYLADFVSQPGKLYLLNDPFNGSSDLEFRNFWNSLASIQYMPQWNRVLCFVKSGMDDEISIYNLRKNSWEVAPLALLPGSIREQLKKDNFAFHAREKNTAGYVYYKIYAGDKLLLETKPVRKSIETYATFSLPEGNYQLIVKRYVTRYMEEVPNATVFVIDKNVRQADPTRVKVRKNHKYLLMLYPALPTAKKEYDLKVTLLPAYQQP